MSPFGNILEFSKLWGALKRPDRSNYFKKAISWKIPNFEGKPLGVEIVVNSAFSYMKVRRAKSLAPQLYFEYLSCLC